MSRETILFLALASLLALSHANASMLRLNAVRVTSGTSIESQIRGRRQCAPRCLEVEACVYAEYNRQKVCTLYSSVQTLAKAANWRTFQRSPLLPAQTANETDNSFLQFTGRFAYGSVLHKLRGGDPAACRSACALLSGCQSFTHRPARNGFCKLFSNTDVRLRNMPSAVTMIRRVSGCMDSSAINYDATATVGDGSCEYSLAVSGCTDSTAANYNPEASISESSACVYSLQTCDEVIYGMQFNPKPALARYARVKSLKQCVDKCHEKAGCKAATYSTKLRRCRLYRVSHLGQARLSRKASWIYTRIDAMCGCTDSNATNYQSAAEVDNNSCSYATSSGCTDSSAVNYDSNAMVDDGSCVIVDAGIAPLDSPTCGSFIGDVCIPDDSSETLVLRNTSNLPKSVGDPHIVSAFSPEAEAVYGPADILLLRCVGTYGNFSLYSRAATYVNKLLAFELGDQYISIGVHSGPRLNCRGEENGFVFPDWYHDVVRMNGTKVFYIHLPTGQTIKVTRGLVALQIYLLSPYEPTSSTYACDGAFERHGNSAMLGLSDPAKEHNIIDYVFNDPALRVECPNPHHEEERPSRGRRQPVPGPEQCAEDRQRRALAQMCCLEAVTRNGWDENREEFKICYSDMCTLGPSYCEQAMDVVDEDAQAFAELYVSKGLPPSGTFCGSDITWDPVHSSVSLDITYSADLLNVSTNVQFATIYSNASVNSGKWYWEITTDDSPHSYIGVQAYTSNVENKHMGTSIRGNGESHFAYFTINEAGTFQLALNLDGPACQLMYRDVQLPSQPMTVKTIACGVDWLPTVWDASSGSTPSYLATFKAPFAGDIPTGYLPFGEAPCA